MPNLFNIIGTDVPIRAATIITKIIETEIVILISMGSSIINPNKIIKPPRMIPFKIVKLISLNSIEIKLSFITLFAKPCTTIADDCTPTFPAIAASVECKRIMLLKMGLT